MVFGGYEDTQWIKWRNYSSSLRGEWVTIIFQWYGDTIYEYFLQVYCEREIQYMSNILCGFIEKEKYNVWVNILCGVYWEGEIQYMSNILCGFYEKEKYIYEYFVRVYWEGEIHYMS
jgi:hypothetical protein